MNVRNLLTLNTGLVFLVALTTLFVPTFFLETNDLEITQTSINQMRVFGAVIIGNGVASWLIRDQPASRTRRAFLLGLGINYLAFAVVNVVNILAIEGENPIVWGIFTVNLLLGSALVYFARNEKVR